MTNEKIFINAEDQTKEHCDLSELYILDGMLDGMLQMSKEFLESIKKTDEAIRRLQEE